MNEREGKKEEEEEEKEEEEKEEEEEECIHPTTVEDSPGSVTTPNIVMLLEEKLKSFQLAPSSHEYLTTADESF